MDLTVTPGGIARFDGVVVPYAHGRGGFSMAKIEGDGATPVGGFLCRWVYWRADRVAEPETGLGKRPLSPADGWCDDPAAPRYNRYVRLPCDAHAEYLWRDDAVYDILIVIGYNDLHTVAGRGSAIFLHVARAGFTPTEGCIALAEHDLRRFLKFARPGSRVIVAA